MNNMSLANRVDQLDPFASLADFSALKWTDLEQNVVYQIVSTHIVNIQHGQSAILSLQKADGSSCSAWACGMLSTKLLHNPMVMVSSQLFVLVTGQKKRARLDKSTIRISIVIYLSNICRTGILLFLLSTIQSKCLTVP